MKDYGLRAFGLAVICQLALSACGSSERITVPLDSNATAAARKSAGKAQLDAEAAQKRASFSFSDPASRTGSMSADSSVGSYNSKQKSLKWGKALELSALTLGPGLLLNGDFNFSKLFGKKEPAKEQLAVAAPTPANPSSDESAIGPALALSQESNNQGRSSGENGDENHHPVEKQPTTNGTALCNAESPHDQAYREAYAIIESVTKEVKETGVTI